MHTSPFGQQSDPGHSRNSGISSRHGADPNGRNLQVRQSEEYAKSISQQKPHGAPRSGQSANVRIRLPLLGNGSVISSAPQDIRNELGLHKSIACIGIRGIPATQLDPRLIVQTFQGI